METLNLQDFLTAQVEERTKTMRKRERKRLDKIERSTTGRKPLGQSMWERGHPVQKVETKYSRKKLKKAVDIYREDGI